MTFCASSRRRSRRAASLSRSLSDTPRSAARSFSAATRTGSSRAEIIWSSRRASTFHVSPVACSHSRISGRLAGQPVTGRSQSPRLSESFNSTSQMSASTTPTKAYSAVCVLKLTSAQTPSQMPHGQRSRTCCCRPASVWGSAHTWPTPPAASASTGVAVIFEPKVLSDISTHVTFDLVHIQLAGVAGAAPERPR